MDERARDPANDVYDAAKLCADPADDIYHAGWIAGGCRVGDSGYGDVLGFGFHGVEPAARAGDAIY